MQITRQLRSTARFISRNVSARSLAATLLLLAVTAGAADKPTEVTVTNTPNVSVTNTPNVRVVQERFQFAGTVSDGCAGSVLGGVPSGRTVVITSVDAGGEDTVRPDIVVWTRQRAGGGFFTHFRGIPLDSYPTNNLFSGTLKMNHRIVPGSLTSGDLFDMFICITPGAGDGDAHTAAAYIVSGYLE